MPRFATRSSRFIPTPSSLTVSVPRLRVGRELDRELLALRQQGRVRQREEAQLVQRVARVAHELAQEDLLLRVERVDDEVQQLLDLRSVLQGLGRLGHGGARSPLGRREGVGAGMRAEGFWRGPRAVQAPLALQEVRRLPHPAPGPRRCTRRSSARFREPSECHAFQGPSRRPRRYSPSSRLIPFTHQCTHQPSSWPSTMVPSASSTPFVCQSRQRPGAQAALVLALGRRAAVRVPGAPGPRAQTVAEAPVGLGPAGCGGSSPSAPRVGPARTRRAPRARRSSATRSTARAAAPRRRRPRSSARRRPCHTRHTPRPPTARVAALDAHRAAAVPDGPAALAPVRHVAPPRPAGGRRGCASAAPSPGAARPRTRAARSAGRGGPRTSRRPRAGRRRAPPWAARAPPS